MSICSKNILSTVDRYNKVKSVIFLKQKQVDQVLRFNLSIHCQGLIKRGV